jgi:hypothetical protein
MGFTRSQRPIATQRHWNGRHKTPRRTDTPARLFPRLVAERYYVNPTPPAPVYCWQRWPVEPPIIKRTSMTVHPREYAVRGGGGAQGGPVNRAQLRQRGGNGIL